MIKYFSGKCPVTGREQKIAVEYFKVFSSGKTAMQYKIKSFECNLVSFNRCSLPNPDDCPIVQTVPKAIY